MKGARVIRFRHVVSPRSLVELLARPPSRFLSSSVAPAVQPPGLISVTLTQRLRIMAGLSGNTLEIKTLLQYCLANFEGRLRYRLLLAVPAWIWDLIPVCCESL